MEKSPEKQQIEITLPSLERGKRAKVVHVTGHGPTRRRIFDMGLVPGSEVEVVRRAPLGDPIEVRVKGYYLSLRKREAELVIVQPLGI